MVANVKAEQGIDVPEAPEGTTPEDQPEAAPEGTTASPEEPDIPEKFRGKSQEDIIRAYQELEQRQGSMAGELGELRKLREEFDQFRNQPAAQPQSFDEDTFDDLVDTSPERAAYYALQAGDGYRLEQALDSWYDIEPRKAQKFERQLELSQVQKQNQEQLARYEEHVQNQHLVTAFTNARARHPEFDRMEDAMVKVANENPELLLPLQKGTLESKERVVEALYKIASYGNQPPSEPQGQEVPYVASTTSSPEGAVQKPVDPLFALAQRLIDEETLVP